MNFLGLGLVVAALMVGARGNFTHRYMSMGAKEFQSRQSRFLTFNTDPNGEISVEMQFSVPFIKIPVAKAMDATKGAVANLNVPALVVSAAIVAVAGFIFPGILNLFNSKMMTLPFYGTAFGREDKSLDAEWWRILTLVDQTLIENNIDTTACMQRAVCWAVKTSTSKVSTGKAATSDKILDGLVTNEWLTKFVDGTPMEPAIKKGLQAANCANEYSTCRVNQKLLSHYAKQFINAINLT